MTNVAFGDLEFNSGVEKNIFLSGTTVTSETIVNEEILSTKVEEYFGTAGEYRAFVHSLSEAGLSLVQDVEDSFGINIINALDVKVLGLEVNSNVITALLTKSVYKQLEGDLPVGFCVSSIKFFMDSQTVAIKVYRLEDTLIENYPTLPEGSEVLVWADYHDFAGYDYEQSFDNYLDIFFLNEGHQAVCDFYDKELPTGLLTGYGIRFHKNTKEIKKVKSYTYNDESTILWQDWKKTVEKARLAPHNVSLN